MIVRAALRNPSILITAHSLILVYYIEQFILMEDDRWSFLFSVWIIPGTIDK